MTGIVPHSRQRVEGTFLHMGETKKKEGDADMHVGRMQGSS